MFEKAIVVTRVQEAAQGVAEGAQVQPPQRGAVLAASAHEVALSHVLC